MAEDSFSPREREIIAEHMISAELWAGTDDNGDPLDSLDSKLADASRASLVADLDGFLDAASDSDLRFWADQLGLAQIGHDFALTRNGHGAGFWDHFSRDEGEEIGRRLTDLAHPYGDSDLYVGDDGVIYAMGAE